MDLTPVTDAFRNAFPRAARISARSLMKQPGDPGTSEASTPSEPQASKEAAAFPLPARDPQEQADRDYAPISNFLGDAISHAATLPQRLFGASEGLRTTGEYDPAPAAELMGSLYGMNAPFTSGLGAAGGRIAGESRLDRIARMAREQEAQMRAEARMRFAQRGLTGETSRSASDLPSRIRQAYFDATGGARNQPVDLAAIRNQLGDVPRDTLDDALRQMHLQPGNTLSGMNNPQQITPLMRQNSLNFKGEPMYSLWITK